jgi:hypothetical protein
MVFEWSSLRSKPGNPTGHPRWPPGYKYKIWQKFIWNLLFWNYLANWVQNLVEWSLDTLILKWPENQRIYFVWLYCRNRLVTYHKDSTWNVLLRHDVSCPL